MPFSYISLCLIFSCKELLAAASTLSTQEFSLLAQTIQENSDERSNWLRSTGTSDLHSNKTVTSYLNWHTVQQYFSGKAQDMQEKSVGRNNKATWLLLASDHYSKVKRDLSCNPYWHGVQQYSGLRLYKRAVATGVEQIICFNSVISLSISGNLSIYILVSGFFGFNSLNLKVFRA